MSLLDQRIARALGWDVSQVQAFSLPALRDLLPAGKLKDAVTQRIQSGAALLGHTYEQELQARRTTKRGRR